MQLPNETDIKRHKVTVLRPHPREIVIEDILCSVAITKAGDRLRHQSPNSVDLMTHKQCNRSKVMVFVRASLGELKACWVGLLLGGAEMKPFSAFIHSRYQKTDD